VLLLRALLLRLRMLRGLCRTARRQPAVLLRRGLQVNETGYRAESLDDVLGRRLRYTSVSSSRSDRPSRESLMYSS